MAFCFVTGSLNGQNILKKANNLYKKQNYCEAIYYYSQYLAVHSNKDIYFKRGVCHYQCRNYDKAIEDIENSIILGNVDKETNLFLAKSYQDRQEFEKAISYYKLYLNDVFKNESEKEVVLNLIKNCSNGVYHKFKSSDHFIENWGSEVNGPNNDMLPLQSKYDYSKFYFASNTGRITENSKKYREFSSEFTRGSWKTPNELFFSNPEQNVLALDLTENDNELLFFLGYELHRGTIYSGKFSADDLNLNAKIKFNGPIHSELGFSYLSFINDTTLVFSSNRAGGQGGYDLYITGIRNGLWFEPVNLGPAVNSEYDEINPFITPDGENLFFSSNNLNSIGGFDVFKSSFFDESWDKPINIGIPLNSSRDEVNFRVLSSGLGAVFSSDRRDMGYGGFDNYWMYFKNAIDDAKSYSQELPFLRNKSLNFIDAYSTESPSEPYMEAPIVVVNEVAENIRINTDTIEEKPVPEPVIISQDSIEVSDAVTIEIPYIYFMDDDFTDNSTVIGFMDKLAGLMMKNKELEVEFIGNSYTWNSNKNNLVLSVKMAQRLADSLELRMINKARIHVKGSGSNYPYAKINGPERSKNLIVKINNRVDVYLHNYDNQKIKIKKDEFFLNKTLLDTRHTLYETIVEGLTYRVQLKSANFLVTEVTQAGFNDAGIEYDPLSEVYTYTVGIYKEYHQAKELFSKLFSNYRTNIKILPYINGLMLGENEILSYAKEYNDLVNFLADNK